ncbi:MAG: methylenetetrahydrofolate reductase [Anaerolineae bacterium SM23_ 63]|nr:MAG: methylenetetrahydrofolate reductase [Anaerolineae bacterium SM23_ 63]HEY47839.1 methylenetetrahydrofolate reductase [Anaerolineae bacterium]
MTENMTNGYKSGSRLERILRAGHFAVTGELGPPQGADGDVIREKAHLLKGFVDAANITDNQTAIVRMSSIGAGTIVVQEGLEPVIQMTCRDRNRLAIQSDLMGAYACGMRNVLCLTGDHQSFGNHPTAKNVHDLDSLQLTQMVVKMRDEKQFQCGDEMEGIEPRFFVGAAANPFGDPFEWRPYRLAKKVKAGADFIQTQLIFNTERFAEYMEKVRELGLHKQTYILAGIGPLKSPGMARYMRDQVPGLDVPNIWVDRMTEATVGIDKDDKKARRDAWRREGIQIAIDLIKELKQIEGVAGVHIMAIEWEEAVKPIVEGAELLPRPEPAPLPKSDTA